MPHDNPDKRGLSLRAKQQGGPPWGKSWFFGIGIDRYQHFSNLNNAVKDVQDLIALLQEKYGLEAEHVITLYNEDATRRNIINKLDRLLREVQSSDRLLIYYSGHGHLMQAGKSQKGFWIPTDAEKDNTAHYIRNSTVRDYLEGIDSLHTLLVSDSCFSGSLFVRGASRAETAMEELEQRPSRWAICSGRHNEEVYDGEPGKNSPFADSILDILRTNRLTKLNVAKLADRVVDLTRANYQQLPEGNPLYGVGHKGGQYIFTLKADEAAEWKVCQNAGTLAAYQAFLAKYPEGMYSEAARTTLAELEEEQAWEQAKAKNTILSYYQYNRDYPSGKYRSEALDAIRQLEEEQAWQQALRTNSLSAFLDYQGRYPQGRHAAEAGKKIEALLVRQQEPAAWQEAQRKGTIAAYQAYLQEYPDGSYAAQAKAAIQKLEEQEQSAEQKRRQEKRAKEQEAARRQQQEKEAAEQRRRIQVEAKQQKPASPPPTPQTQPEPQRSSVSSSPASSSIWEKWVPMGLGGLVVVVLVIWGISQMGGKVTLQGQTYNTFIINGITWLAENLNYEVPDSWCYDYDPANCQQYGRLYTWVAAKKACAALGDGWRLPTDEEWRAMAKLFGGADDDATDGGKAAYQSMIKGGSDSYRSGFAALLGGWRDSNGYYHYLGARGYYWSATAMGVTVDSTTGETATATAIYYYFNRYRGELDRYSGRQTVGLSCRCLQD